MKYMGSKRVMLENGLGRLLRDESRKCDRIVDLFCGAASVSWFAAQHLNRPVLATDLQSFATVLAASVVERTVAVDSKTLSVSWIARSQEQRQQFACWREAAAIDGGKFNTATWSKRARNLCAGLSSRQTPVTTAYGGYYFSPTQALTVDAMLRSLPTPASHRTLCLASSIMAASKCAASPGHTAQPFGTGGRSAIFLREAWSRDPLKYATVSLDKLCPVFAKKQGHVCVADAVEQARELTRQDLVFVDPPYSGVHYSRFYHVLETVARGGCGTVEGAGRYPPREERPFSQFSRKTESNRALSQLIERLAAAGSTVVFTFPAATCSNGLSGAVVEEIAEQWFKVEKETVKSCFSTLGGNNSHRDARQSSKELILLLKPRRNGCRLRGSDKVPELRRFHKQF